MKTRLISLLLAFSMALTFLPVGAVSAFAAETFVIDGITYTVTGDDTVSVTGYDNASAAADLVLSDTVTNNGKIYTVTAIGAGAFSSRNNLKSIMIPMDVVTIGQNAFFHCAQLETVKFEQGSALETIEKSAFAGSGVTEIKMPKSVKNIGEYAFELCEKMTSFTFPEGSSLESLSDGLFMYCYKLESFEIPDSVTRVNNWPFHSCISLESVVIPDGLTSFGTAPFFNCEKLNHVVIPDGITELGNIFFSGCKSLTDVVLPASLRKIGAGAFGQCPEKIKVSYKGTQWDSIDIVKDSINNSQGVMVDNSVILRNSDNIHRVHKITVNGGTFTIDNQPADSTSVFVRENGAISLSAAPAPQDDLEFEQWEVSPASALSDLTSTGFDLTASETSFHMPDQDITLTAQYRPSAPTIDDAPVDAPVDPGISTAVTIIGGALLVGGLHQLGTELWLIHHLPKGTAIPETRIELAEVLWKDAGQPAPAAEAAYTDIDTDDTDAQQAAQWAIENELMTLRSSEHPDKFDPHVPVSTVKAIRAWKKAQQMKPSTK